MAVNSFKFMSRTLADSLKIWPYADTSGEAIPWTPLAKPLAQCRVALVSSGGFYRKDDIPFDLDHERREPLWGDPSFREIPRGTGVDELRAAHLHYENSHAMKDLNCMFPLGVLEEMHREGKVGAVSDFHISLMGYQPRVGTLVRETGPRMAGRLLELGVDAVLLSAG